MNVRKKLMGELLEYLRVDLREHIHESGIFNQQEQEEAERIRKELIEAVKAVARAKP